MERIIIKLQSVSDIITNSSSEIFQIKANMSEQTFYRIWHNLLNKYEKVGSILELIILTWGFLK